MKRHGFLVLTLTAAISFSCSDTDDNSQTNQESEFQEYSSSSSGAISSEWREYLQSSDEGLWENSKQHLLKYRPDGFFTDPEAMDPLVYKPYSICCAGDTVFIADIGTQEIVAATDEAGLIWKIGGAGEGPGHFPQVSTLAVSERYIAALNFHLGRIDFFYRDGNLSHTLNLAGAQDIAAVDDTTFIVGSTAESGGHLHIVSAKEGILRSFGEVEMVAFADIPRKDLMRICLGESDRVAVFNRYEGYLTIYNLNTEECIYRGNRTYPSSPEDRELPYPIGGNVYVGREGMINVMLPNFMDDGSFLSDPEYVDFAPVTAVDRYDWDGSYLDSYCLPDSSLNYAALLSDDRIIARNFAEETLCVYSIED